MKLHISLDLSPRERLALERALGGGLLQRDAGEAWAERTLRWRLQEMAASLVRDDQYRATDGSIWHLSLECPPIPSRKHDWSGVHDNYDGAEDSGCRHLAVSGETREECILEIEAGVDNGRWDL